MLHTLLLNSTYEPISFISERKVFKMLIKDKVEVLSHWDEEVAWGKAKIKHPATIRLHHHVRWIPRKLRFNRTAVFKRDQYSCQYCAKVLIPSKLTLDHILPKTKGGENSWRNCVTACFDCNNKKGNKTPEEAKMPLIKKPTVPQITIFHDYILIKTRHKDWDSYIIKP